MEIEATIRSKYQLLSPAMNERSGRLWAGAEARALGRGGIALVQRATGMAFNTVHRGMKELDWAQLLAPDRVRLPGGGRKKATALQPPDHRYAPQPLVLQRPDDAFGHGNRPVLSHRTETLLHLPSPEQVTEHLGGEHAFLVANEMLGRSVPRECLLQRLHDPACVGAFQGHHGHHRAGEVIDRHQYASRPDPPAHHSRAVHAPHVVGVAGDDLPGCRGRGLGLRRGGRVPGLGLQQDVPDRRGGHEHAQQPEDVGDPVSTELRIPAGSQN